MPRKYGNAAVPRHGNAGVPKSREHRRHLAASMRQFWRRAHAALAEVRS